jgi:isopenicillin-N epimerase
VLRLDSFTFFLSFIGMPLVLTSVVEYFLAGSLLALLFYLLRASIDRRKGAIVEVATVTLPIVFGALLLAVCAPGLTLIEFGRYLSYLIQVEFLALPIFAAVRIFERVRARESIQLADLFRLTTVTSLAAFVFTSFHPTWMLVPAMICLLAYIGADWSAQSRARERNLAVVFVAGFLMLIGSTLLLGVTLSTGQDRSYSNSLRLLPIYHGIALVAFLIPHILATVVGRLVLRNWAGFHSVALLLARWQQAVGNPRDQIYVRTILDLWQFRQSVCYLNHGSFGAVPLELRDRQNKMRIACEQEPMDWLARQMEPEWFQARFKLAVWLGTQPDNIAFCENATAAMNEIAAWFPLSDGDEVLLNDHEYGAVKRIWQRRCSQDNAKLVEVVLPLPLRDPHQIVEAIVARCTERTRLVVASHITSPTAIKLPVEELCAALRERGIATCIDGPHALLQEQVKLNRLKCDFYTASCHKWLCAPLGSGFVYVDPKWHALFQSARLSWGRLLPHLPEAWSHELLWTGSRDYSAFLTVPAAIDFFNKFDCQKLDERNHALACYARRQLLSIAGSEPVTPEGRQWFGWMVGVWLPHCDYDYSVLQKRLWEEYKIEVPIVKFAGHYLVRVSTHLYNSTHDIDFLVRAIRRELSRS